MISATADAQYQPTQKLPFSHMHGVISDPVSNTPYDSQAYSRKSSPWEPVSQVSPPPPPPQNGYTYGGNGAIAGYIPTPLESSLTEQKGIPSSLQQTCVVNGIVKMPFTTSWRPDLQQQHLVGSQDSDDCAYTLSEPLCRCYRMQPNTTGNCNYDHYHCAQRLNNCKKDLQCSSDESSDTSVDSNNEPSDNDISFEPGYNFRRLATYQVDKIDEIIAAAAREIGLSTTEHSALKMDLFRNYVRTYEALKDTIENQQLQCILHPILAEIVAKNLYEVEEFLVDEETVDAPSTIANVPRFRHGAVFIHRVILINGDTAKIACTYAMDLPKKIKVFEVTRRLAIMLKVPKSVIRLCHKEKAISSYPNETLESLGITPGSAIEAYVLSDTPDGLCGIISSLINIEPHLSIREAIASNKHYSYAFEQMYGYQASYRRHSGKSITGFKVDNDTMGFVKECDAVPTMAAMERLAKTFDSAAREIKGGTKRILIRGRRPCGHPCPCDCAICGVSGTNVLPSKFNVPVNDSHRVENKDQS